MKYQGWLRPARGGCDWIRVEAACADTLAAAWDALLPVRLEGEQFTEKVVLPQGRHPDRRRRQSRR